VKNYYEILGVNISATSEEIRRAYRILARRYHPDMNPDLSEEKFKTIAEAYTVLSDSDRRQNYDLELEAHLRKNSRTNGFEAYRRAQRSSKKAARTTSSNTRQTGPSANYSNGTSASGLGVSFSEMLGEIPAMGGALKRYAKSIAKQGQGYVSWLWGHHEPIDSKTVHSLKVSVLEVSITIKEAILGTKKTIEIVEPEGLRKVSVKIPPGVRNGSVVRLQGRGLPREDLVLVIRIAYHPYLSIHPKGLVVEIPVTVHEAIAGATIMVPTLEEPAAIKIPAGTNSGTELRVKEKGVPLKDGGRGDLFVRILVKIPEHPEAVGLKEKANELSLYYETPVRDGMPKSLLEE
jgi:curved DNA-binding protein